MTTKSGLQLSPRCSSWRARVTSFPLPFRPTLNCDPREFSRLEPARHLLKRHPLDIVDLLAGLAVDKRALDADVGGRLDVREHVREAVLRGLQRIVREND